MHRYLPALLVNFMCMHVCIAPPAVAAVANDDCAQQMVELLSAGTGSRPTAAVAAAVARHIDYDYITEYAVGPDEWRRLDGTQRKQCIRLVRRWLEERHYPRWHKLFKNGQYRELTTSRSAGETLVRAALHERNKKYFLTWRLHTRGQNCQVISLAVDGKDLLSRLRARFQKRLQRGGHERLVASLGNASATTREYLVE